MWRRLFTIASALSLLLCVAAFVQMYRGYQAPQTIEFAFSGERWEVHWDHGTVWLDNDPQIWLDQARRRAALFAWQDANDRLELQDVGELWAMEELAAGQPLERSSKSVRAKVLARLLQKPGGAERVAVLQAPLRPFRTYSHPATNLVVILSTLLLPAVWLARAGRALKGRRERLRKGLCVCCGYDLRATPGRCPECGAVNL